MADDAWLTIGQFARLSGLTVHTLRHYDDVGLLRPADVDPATGYRRYDRAQVGPARVIRALRWIDLPVEEIREVLLDTDGETPREVLERHRDRLGRRQSLTDARLADIDHFLEEGITMAPTSGARPVQLKITVDDADAAIAFYQEAFGFHWDVTRRTEDADYASFVFGRYGDDDFFLIHLLADPEQVDRLGPTTFGLAVDDLDRCHARAVEAGGTEITAPHEVEGMPRCSAVSDPSGNWIWLYQG